ncbi:glutathione S-transferase family protein [Thalassomonas sp. RHCl1]|uniref:glutathione S-transferase family protein n=1 Tax=Thalassomonas sp. RHCl1 TaxID=2995320 RepID=UPI00248C532D|nr:glutathione S-transferase family protein [Thalassomonas sp. RHCl1]
MNIWLHQHINRNVYHVGFAKNQTDYDTASSDYFSALENLDKKLERSLYLFGDRITLSDFFLLPTLVRMEAVYEVHFKANLKPLKAFKNLYRYMLNLVSNESIRETVDIAYMKAHYYISHSHINPTGIIPSGPEIIW